MQLTFSEQPEPALSAIRVLGPSGEEEQRGAAKAAPGDPLTLAVPVRALPRGVYTVAWKVVSAVDGHATDGSYAFGVRQSPRGVATESSIDTKTSVLEPLARWVLIVGLVALLGAAVAVLAGFGGRGGADLRLAAVGWLAAAVGLLLLAEAQRRASGSSFGELLDTGVGEALIWRGAGLAIALVGLLLARRPGRARRAGFALAALGALGAIVAHAAAGHAAAGSWSSLLTVGAQVAHFAAAGVWLGGLAALLLGTRGAPSAEKAAAVRRFAAVALAMLVVVFITGTLRAVDELSSWGDLIDSGYGRTILAKLLLLGLIVGVAARNRRRSLPAAERDLGPLRRTSALELALAMLALGAAALLGALAPPVGGSTTPAGLTVAGADFATTTRVELSTASAEPGPNRFTTTVEDYDSGEAIEAARVSLRLEPLDDPEVEPATLALKPLGEGEYAGAGAGLAFDGRWRAVVTVEREGESVTVPLELEVPGPDRFVSVLRVPGKPAEYTMQIGAVGSLRIVPDPLRAGPSKVYVSSFTTFGSYSKVGQIVVTAAAANAPLRQRPVRRLGPGRFVSAIELVAGRFEISVVARTVDGTRLRGVFELHVPPG